MDFTNSFRLILRLTTTSLALAGGVFQPIATAQVAVSPAPVAQPVWVNPQPVLQVGPNGAVNLDQSMQYTAQFPAAMYPPQQVGAQPYMAQQFVQPYVPQQPYVAQPPVMQPFVAQPMAAQPMAQQPAWGTPFTPATNVAGSTPYLFVHRTSVFGELLYMRPRDTEVAYAYPIDDVTFLPSGPVAVVDSQYDIGFRAGINVALDEGSSLRAQYTRLRFDDTNSVTADAGQTLVALPFSILFPFPSGIFADTSAAARHQIDLDTIDLDFRGLWSGCECGNYAHAVNYVGGVRFGSLDQRFNATFTDTDAVSTQSSEITFDGIGMRFGLEGERYYATSGFFVYGSSMANILFGEFDAKYNQVTTPEDPMEPVVSGNTSWSAGRVVPVVELELGAGWLGMNRHLKLSAGYRVSAWFNVVKTDDWLWAVQSGDFRDMGDTITFDGLVGRAEWLF